MCEKLYPSHQGISLAAYTTTARFFPTTGWMPVSSVGSWSFNMNMRAEQGLMQARPAVQFASVRPEIPDDPQTIGSVITTEGYHYVSTTPLDVKSKMWWRFGISYSSQSASVAEASFSLDVAIDSRGRTLRPTTVNVTPTNTKFEDVLYPISGWESSIDADKFKAGLVFMNNLHSSTDYAIYQRAGNDRQAPDNWVQIKDWDGIPVGNSEVATGERASGATRAWVQYALGIRTNDGAEPSRLTAHVLPSIYNPPGV